jgi:hypothetical protein
MTDNNQKASSCSWEGLGFGAHYDDAGCVEGFASDLDDCEHTADGEVLIAIGTEVCPQCSRYGIGRELGFAEVGATALHRQRARDELFDLIDDLPQDVKEDVIERLNGLFTLLLKLEGAKTQQEVDAEEAARQAAAQNPSSQRIARVIRAISDYFGGSSEDRGVKP